MAEEGISTPLAASEGSSACIVTSSSIGVRPSSASPLRNTSSSRRKEPARSSLCLARA